MVGAREFARMRAEGLLAHDEAVARVVERFGVPGSGEPARVLCAEMASLFGEGSDNPPVPGPGERRTQHLRVAVRVRP